MKKILKNLFLKLKPAIEVVLSVVTIPAGLVFLLYRRVGSRRLPISTAVLKRIGVFPIRNHHYEPLFKDLYLRRQQGIPCLELAARAATATLSAAEMN